MSAAIEGIQTCFHASHLEGETSILLAHPITYPAILVGFALVGSLMQWCSIRAHSIRDEELQSASLLDVRSQEEDQKRQMPRLEELAAIELEANSNRIEFEPYSPKFRLTNKQPKRGSALSFHRTLSLCLPATLDQHARQVSGKRRRFVLNSARHRSSESVPTEINEQTRISLISLKSAASFNNPADAPQQSPIEAISGSIGSSERAVNGTQAESASYDQTSKSKADKYWLWVRCSASPVALVSCAQIVYLINDELITEVADATLSILVVVLLFLASYPPMKKAGKVLLQTAPDQVDLAALEVELKSVSPLIQDIQELHVWSLTPRSNRVATCKLVLELRHIESEKHLTVLLAKIRQKFLEQNIRCTTIEPVLILEPKSTSAASQSAPAGGREQTSGCCAVETLKRSCAHDHERETDQKSALGRETIE